LNISNFTIEDFVLNREFRAWVFTPTQGSNNFWQRLFEKSPGQVKNAKIAKEILLNMNYPNHRILEMESLEMWKQIEKESKKWNNEKIEKGRVVVLNSDSILKRNEFQTRNRSWFTQQLRVACILLATFSFSLIFELLFKQKPVKTEFITDLVYDEFIVPPGVKSTLILNDGSKVLLNSGSSLRFIKNFEADKRIVYLKGEAYFEVSRDSLRPFSVITEGVATTALGTAFNISAYSGEDLKVALVEGKVSVEYDQSDPLNIFLEKGEMLKINPKSGTIDKGRFDDQLVLAWTMKKIFFQKVTLKEAIRILENWYGVKFICENTPSQDLMLYGVFQDETLENILNGLSYSARFSYKINKDEVKIFFNKP
jgi:hypothetical protein